MRDLFKWLEKKKGPKVQAEIIVRPPVLSPSDGEQLRFAEWRAGHIQRWLDDPANATRPERKLLTIEKDMYLSLLRLAGHDV